MITVAIIIGNQEITMHTGKRTDAIPIKVIKSTCTSKVILKCGEDHCNMCVLYIYIYKYIYIYIYIWKFIFR